MLALGTAGFGLAEIEDDVLALEALDGGVEHFLLAVRVFLENRVALGFAHFLEDHLLGKLRGDASQGRGVPVHADLAAHFGAGSHFVGLLQRDLVHRIFDLVIAGDNGFVDIGRDLARLLVELAAHVFLRFVELACRQGNGFLDRANHDLGLDAFLPAEKLDALIKGTGHSSLLSLQFVAAR